MREPVDELVHVVDRSVGVPLNRIWLARAKVGKWHFSEVNRMSALVGNT
jgi:hypothetical protein